MKKMLIVSLFLAIMMVAGSAFACIGQGCYEGDTATGIYGGLAADHAYSLTQKGNDFGEAGGYYGIGADLETYASADGYTKFLWWKFDNKAFQQGIVYGESETKAWSWTHDSGLTSKSGAGIKANDGFVITEGLATGKEGCKEFVQSRIIFGADLYQNNQSKEVGYEAGGVSAGNHSELSFKAATSWEKETDRDLAFQINGSSYTPDVKTMGESKVTIDPYGNTRSIEAHTENMANIEFSGRCAPEVALQNASVAGKGFVDGIIGKGAAYGEGTATFNYSGYTNGSGQANLNIVVKDMGGSTSVLITGSSSSVADGAPQQLQ